MYTRLYTNVLNRYHWMYSATAFNHAYADSGVFCINSSAHPTQLRALVQVIVHELAILASGKKSNELQFHEKRIHYILVVHSIFFFLKFQFHEKKNSFDYTSYVLMYVPSISFLNIGGIESVEFNRAKSQLKSMLMMNLESRPVIFEDLARQVLAQGHREEPEKYIQKINQVTPQDIQRVAEKMLRFVISRKKKSNSIFF